jgi:putative aminopeptidase FrvX
MEISMKALIQQLVEVSGPSGYESEIREYIRSVVASFADSISVDTLGNLIARKGQKSDKGISIMLAAHMDEIGLMATHVDERGFVRFVPIGGVFLRNCLGGRVRFINGTGGVIGSERVERADQLPPFEKMYIDVGAVDRADCPVHVGDIAIFERPFVDWGNRLVSKAMDDRIGVAVLVETMRQLKSTPHQVDFVFSVQEEVGTRGATTAAYGLDPDLGLSVDVTLTGDTPKGTKMDVSLGKGPAIKVRDSGMIADPKVVNWMIKAAKKLKIPYQLEVLEGGSTDARSIQVARSGVPAGCLSIPCRYVHSPSEMVDFQDVENSVKLLLELLSNPVRLE